MQFQLRVCVHSKPEIIPVCLQPHGQRHLALHRVLGRPIGHSPAHLLVPAVRLRGSEKAALKGEELKLLVSVS